MASEKKAVLRREGIAWVLRTPEGEILRMWSVLAYSVVDVFFICCRRYGMSNVMYSCDSPN
jgi:hypothetical protein